MKKIILVLSLFLFQVSFLFSQSGIINTIAGNGIAGYSGDGGYATSAELYNVYGVAVDNSGNVYISDAIGVIRKVNTAGIISTIAGNGVSGYSGDGGLATDAEIEPCGIAIDKNGNIFIAENGYSHRVRIVNPLGIISTLAGNGFQGYTGDGGPATLAELNTPWGVRIDKIGNVYIADIASEAVRMVDTLGIIHTFAGNGYHVGNYGGYFGDGGPATAAELDWPEDVDFDNSGNVYIADEHNYCIRKVNSSGIISTFAGVDYPGYYGDGGPAAIAEFHSPTGIAINDSGVYIVDGPSSYRIRKVNSSGIISTFAGTVHGFSGDGGPATNAELIPLMLASDTLGNIYISDAGNNRIREITIPITTGVNNFKKFDELQISPNPAQNQIYVQLQGNAKAELIELYNITGQMVMEQKCETNSQLLTFNCQLLQNGLYFLKVQMGDGSTIVKKVEIIK